MKNLWLILTYKYVHDLVGKDIPVDKTKSICESLEMKVLEETADGLKLEILLIV